MPVGLIVLVGLALIVLFGAAHRVLDRMHLTDTYALMVLGLLFVGSFIDIPVLQGRTTVTVNVGGALVPTVLALYVIARAGTNTERVRAVIASLVTAGVIWGIARLTDFGPHGGTRVFIDPLWLFALVGGIVAYLLGRSRRSAFVAGILGVILFQIVDVMLQASSGQQAALALGGAGFFDTVILSGVISVGLAEIVGETRERLQGGPSQERPEPLRQALSDPDKARSDDDNHDRIGGGDDA